ncbi:Photosystem I chlorophyll a apoprotein A2 [Capsicum baccatum]|uniref:photosystem I n=1 Tax=Capsicum baccatum TaxID=33114 RepID=A0A2G2WXI4_CAPBA|nr:Photosystem I chlorophyll a apoprotein A2 [Capsicum baccatum]
MFLDTAIQLQPIFSQWIQNTHALAPGTTAPGATTRTSLTWGGFSGKVALFPLPLGTVDFLVYHTHAFTIHVTVLILLKGVLLARSSCLIPDMANLGFHFYCDGPGRGGTCQDPLHVRPISHAIWDPHFGQLAMEASTRGGALARVNIAYSGVYQWWYTIGLCTNQDLYPSTLFLLLLSSISLIAVLFGISSLAWIRHLVHVAIPASIGEYVWWNNFLDVLPHPQGLGAHFTGQWNLYAQNHDPSSHLFGTAQGAGTAILTLLGGFHPQTQSLWLTDIGHSKIRSFSYDFSCTALSNGFQR